MSSTPPEQYSMLPIKDAVKLLNEKDQRIKELEKSLWCCSTEGVSLVEQLKEKDQRIKELEDKLCSVDYVLYQMFDGSGINDRCSLNQLTEDYLREIQKIIDINP